MRLPRTRSSDKRWSTFMRALGRRTSLPPQKNLRVGSISTSVRFVRARDGLVTEKGSITGRFALVR